MSRKTIGIHSCWLDSWCRKFGVPPFLYFHLWWITIRLNPPYQKDLKGLKYTNRSGEEVQLSPWSPPWHWVQVWRNRG